MSSMRWIAALFLCFAWGSPGTGAPASGNGHFVVDPASGFAAAGLDPVSYFVDGAIREGLPAHEAAWNGAAWRFANEGNRTAFLDDPDVYAPQFGGHCPVALARGYPAEGNPQVWTIYRDRLYFFFSNDNLAAFRDNPETLLAEAGGSWKRLFPY